MSLSERAREVAPALLRDAAALNFVTELVTKPVGENWTRDVMRRRGDQAVYYLAEQMGYDYQGVDREKEAADARAYLRTFGRRLDSCAAFPTGVSIDASSRQGLVEAAIALCGQLIDRAADRDARPLVADESVAAFFTHINCCINAYAEESAEDSAVLPETAQRATARTLLRLAGYLGYVREPSVGSYEGYLLVDASDAGWFLLALLFLVDVDRAAVLSAAPRHLSVELLDRRIG